MVMYLVVFLLNMFGVTVPYIHQGGIIGIIISAVVIVVAALNLLLDFDLIEMVYVVKLRNIWSGTLRWD